MWVLTTVSVWNTLSVQTDMGAVKYSAGVVCGFWCLTPLESTETARSTSLAQRLSSYELHKFWLFWFIGHICLRASLLLWYTYICEITAHPEVLLSQRSARIFVLVLQQQKSWLLETVLNHSFLPDHVDVWSHVPCQPLLCSAVAACDYHCCYLYLCFVCLAVSRASTQATAFRTHLALFPLSLRQTGTVSGAYVCVWVMPGHKAQPFSDSWSRQQQADCLVKVQR